ncbi:hypothetical protein A1O3_02503 [Capronia epimyces CBS 606.96]|uniref:Major facilitator superfamily (MFS) profile domain-containing protein n=1 Tax=Capronia epimyces CBS 606.96 TaxID=1182542 RepID=W9YJM4_9EURO|nr:uncharacterized protein A1O3_02503 [Capronia epimyces CBS 606.96]EXJ89436.1 hypothetical protein A1O3_02503 [Capronia epimyces CBS 606.96]
MYDQQDIAAKEHPAVEPRDLHQTASLGDDENGATHLSAKQNQRLLLKTDLVVTPLIVLSMTLAFLDKNGLAYAAVYGLREDNHLVGQDYSWVSSVFYFGYLAMEFPNLWLITRLPIGKYIGGCLCLWGIALCLMAVCHNFGGLATIRFFLGVFEAALLPCMLIVNSMWYCRAEQPIRTAFWYNTFAGYIFLIYGSITIGAGILVFFALPDSPKKAWFFNAEERKLVVVRLAENQTGVESRKKFRTAHIIEALKDPKYWLIIACSFGYAITNAGITNFNPLIISGYGFSKSKTVLMATPQAAVAMVSQAILTAITFFIPNLRCVCWIISSLIGLAGAVMVHVLDVETQRDASLAGVYIMGFYNVPWVFMLSLQSSNTGGATKKSFIGISVAIIYAVGNIVGPQFYLSSQSPHYPLGIGSLMFGFALMAFSGIFYLVACLVENKRRDHRYGPVLDNVARGMEADLRDETDGQNHNFRYTF